MSSAHVIKKPWVTEKATALGAAGKYVFLLHGHATKNEVKKAVHELYHVDVASVNIVNRPPKIKRFRGRRGTTSVLKKAIVTLKAGQKIDIA